MLQNVGQDAAYSTGTHPVSCVLYVAWGKKLPTHTTVVDGCAYQNTGTFRQKNWHGSKLISLCGWSWIQDTVFASGNGRLMANGAQSLVILITEQ